MKRYCLVRPANLSEPEIKEYFNYAAKTDEEEGYILIHCRITKNMWDHEEVKPIPFICEYTEVDSAISKKIKDKNNGYECFTDVITGKKYWGGKIKGNFPEDHLVLSKVKDIDASEVLKTLKLLKEKDIFLYSSTLENLDNRIKQGYEEFIERLEETTFHEQMNAEKSIDEIVSQFRKK